MADGVIMASTSPVSVDVNKGLSTPTSTATASLFTNGNYIQSCILVESC